MTQVIIVEDHQSLIDGLRLLIDQQPDITVMDAAQDGVELLKILEHKKPHLILTDISMPRMNGIELCETVKEKYPDIKVLAFTMFDDDNAVQDMLRAGVDGYLLKIRPLSEVCKAIVSIMNGQQYMDPSIDVSKLENAINSKQQTILSRSEREILKMIAAGNSSSEIAQKRFTAVSTVHKHRRNMIQKLGLSGKSELLRYALQKHPHFK
jgi:two-component system nitrate/nitrite response regulator NarL